jgi:hypothetical protein
MFDWDEANLAHIARHGVTREEAEQTVLIAPLDLTHEYYEDEERFLLAGITSAGRVLLVVTTVRGDRMRVVTAYTAPAAMKRKYWEEKGEKDGE